MHTSVSVGGSGVRRLAVAAVAASSLAGMMVGGTPAHGAVAGHSGPIAFAAEGKWFEANPDGGGQREILLAGHGVTWNGVIQSVVLSPDGSKAALAVSDPTIYGLSSIWVADADGAHPHQVTLGLPNVNDSSPVWSADGATVYFNRDDAGLRLGAPTLSQATTTIYRVAADGSSAPAPVYPLAAGDVTERFVSSVSSTGKMAYGVANTASEATALEIADLATGTVLVHLPNLQGTAVFSPDGSRFAFFGADVSKPGSGTFAAVFNADGTNRIDLTSSAMSGILGGAWSPDGTQIAYTVRTNGNDQIFVQQAAAGTTGTPILTPPANDTVGSWLDAAPGGLAVPRPTVVRIGGADRVSTALDVADHAYGGVARAEAAVLSRDDTYADALAGNALAGRIKAPLLLTNKNQLDTRVAAELSKTLAPHATVYLLGGDQALSPGVQQAVSALGFTTKRLAGGDRYATAVEIAKILPARFVLVATGDDFPDALAAGPAAATDDGGVVVLSHGGSLPASTRAYLDSLTGGPIYLRPRFYGVGGQGVAALQTAYPTTFSAAVDGIKGADRYATAAAVANKFFPVSYTRSAAVATGGAWPDALSGGALAGFVRAPLLLAEADTIPAPEQTWLHGHAAQLVGLSVFGGTKAVPDSALAEAADAAWGVGAWDQVS